MFGRHTVAQHKPCVKQLRSLAGLADVITLPTYFTGICYNLALFARHAPTHIPSYSSYINAHGTSLPV